MRWTRWAWMRRTRWAWMRRTRTRGTVRVTVVPPCHGNEVSGDEIHSVSDKAIIASIRGVRDFPVIRPLIRRRIVCLLDCLRLFLCLIRRLCIGVRKIFLIVFRGGIFRIDFKILCQDFRGIVKTSGEDGNLFSVINRLNPGRVKKAAPGAFRGKMDAVKENQFRFDRLAGNHFVDFYDAACFRILDGSKFHGTPPCMDRISEVGGFERDLFSGDFCLDLFRNAFQPRFLLIGYFIDVRFFIFPDFRLEFSAFFRIISEFFLKFFR